MTPVELPAGTRVASYDIGSNSVIMLVAEKGADGAWHAVDDRVSVARLSEGLDASGVLAPAAIERTREILVRYADRAAELGVRHAVATGTAPFRRSSNGADVATTLGRALGTPIRVVSGEREAHLSLLATRRSFDHIEDMLVVDIGGASTELIRARADRAAAMKSLDIGSVRLTERCVREAPFSDADRARLQAAVAAELAGDAVDDLLAGGAPTVVGIAGTVTTIVTVAEAMRVYDASTVHGYALPLSEVDRVFDALATRTIAEREELPGMPPKRADVLPAGAWLLGAILRRAGVDQVLVSDRGTRWGRLYAEFA